MGRGHGFITLTGNMSTGPATIGLFCCLTLILPAPGAALNGKGGDPKGWDGDVLGKGSLSLAATPLPATTEEGRGLDKPRQNRI